MKKYNLISSVFLFLVSLGFISGGFHFGFGSWRNPGPGLLSVTFGIVLMVLSTFLLTMTLTKTLGEAETKQFWNKKGSWKPVLYTTLSLIAYILILKPIGFILTTFLFVFFLMRFICKKRWFISIGTALIFSLVSYCLFSYLLGTPLPKGNIYGCTIRYISWV